MGELLYGRDAKAAHDVGGEDCTSCWPGYPARCECGGLVHAHFGDENSDGDYWLEKCCDKCGDDYEERADGD